MRGKDLLYSLSFIDDDIVEEAGREGMPACFTKGDKVKVRSRRRRQMAVLAACLMLAVCSAVTLSQTDLLTVLDTGTGEASDGAAGESCDSEMQEDAAAGEDEAAADMAAPDRKESAAGGSAGAADAGAVGEPEARQNNGGSSDKNAVSADSGAAAQSSSDQNASDVADAEEDSSAESTYGTGDGALEEEPPLMSQSPSADTDEDMYGGRSDAGSASGGASGTAGLSCSEELSGYLASLDYTNPAGSGAAEYTLIAADGTVYELSLTESFVRSGAAEAALTAAQTARIAALLQQ